MAETNKVLSRSEISPRVLRLLKSNTEKNPKTLHTYAHLLTTLYHVTAKTSFDADLFKDEAAMVAAVDAAYPNSKASKASAWAALLAVTGIDEYRARMHVLSSEIQARYKEQKLSEKRPKAQPEAIRKVHERWMEEYERNTSQKSLVNALLTGLSSGFYPELPPRRLEWGSVHIIHEDDDYEEFDHLKKNYTDGKEIVLHDHKNARWTEQPVRLPFPAELKPLFEVRKVSGDPWLLVNTKGEPFSTSALHERLKALFSFSVDVLRQSYVTEFNKGMNKLSDMEAVAAKMGNSLGTQVAVYTKK